MVTTLLPQTEKAWYHHARAALAEGKRALDETSEFDWKYTGLRMARAIFPTVAVRGNEIFPGKPGRAAGATLRNSRISAM